MTAVRKYRPPLKKRVLKSAPVIWLLALMLSLLIRMIYLTCRVEKHLHEKTRLIAAGEAPAIFCLWHGRMAMMPFIQPRGRRAFVLISRHADGMLISKLIRFFGVGTVHGSRSRGVLEAIRGMTAVTHSGGNIAITPDGPRGPFQKAAPGAVYLAAETGTPIVGLVFSASRHWRFKSWDRFMLPKPFSTLVFVASAPIYVAKDADIVNITQQLEESLNRITQAADKRAGVMA